MTAASTELGGLPRLAISFVLPAYNEEDNIERAIEEVVSTAERYCDRFEVLVVDDGSTDRTVELVEKAGEGRPEIKVVRRPRNGGYGQALRSGLTTATMEWVFFTDADLQFDTNEIARLLPWADHVDVVAGYRVRRQDPPSRRLVAAVWNYLVRVLFYVPVRDIDCAFKLMRRSVFDDLDLVAVGNMVNTELMVMLGRSGHGVVEVGVTHYPRTAGKARGVTPKVAFTAFVELFLMFGKLRAAGPPRGELPPTRLPSRREASE